MSEWKSHEAHELFLYAISDGTLYRQSATPIIANLRRKAQKGLYSPQLAVKAWLYHAERAAKAYEREHMTPGTWSKVFPPSARREAADAFEGYYRESVKGTSRDRRSSRTSRASSARGRARRATRRRSRRW